MLRRMKEEKEKMIKQMFKFGRKFPGVLEEVASRSYDNSVASDLSRHRDTVKASVTLS